jgi:predicted nucleic-acid-binding Zn-ribbon protein
MEMDAFRCDPRCPKCDSITVRKTYGKDYDAKTYKIVEFIEILCLDCGYSWRIRTADAEDEE